MATIANHGTVPVYVLIEGDIIVIGGVVVVVTDVHQRVTTDDGLWPTIYVYDITGVAQTADDDGNAVSTIRDFTDFTAQAAFPRLRIID